VVEPDGTIRQAAGTGTAGSTGDGGAAIAARINAPVDVAWDGLGNLYIAEASGFRVRRVSTQGIITTLAGTGVQGATGDDGPATLSTVNPFCLAVDKARGRVFIGDLGNRRIRVVEPDGIIRRFAGTGAAGSSGDGGQAVAAAVSARGLAVDEEGVVFVADSEHRVRRIGLDGVITTVAGTGVAGADGDGGPATAAQLSTPVDVDIDTDGRLFIAENDTARIRMVDIDGTIATAVGSGFFSDVDAVATETLQFGPVDARFDAQGRFLFPQPADHRLVRREHDGTQTAVAGNGSRTAPVFGTRAKDTGMFGVESLVQDADGSLIVALGRGHRVVRILVDGTVAPLAGTGVAGFAGDGGPAVDAVLNQPEHVSLDAQGQLYVAEDGNARIRRIDVNGTITTVAGTGVPGFSGDGGLATAARLNRPFAVRARADGSFVIADRDNQRLREVDAAGIIRTIAGTGARAFSNDGLAATASAITDPTGLAFDLDGRVLFADSATRRVRRIEADGTLTTVAGSGFSGFTGDGGQANLARLTTPRSLDVDPGGRLLITDQGANAIRLVDLNTGVISTVAGRVHPAMTGRDGRARIVDGRHALALGDGRFLVTQGQTGRIAIVRPLAGVVDGVIGYDASLGGDQTRAATFRFGLAVGMARIAERVFVIDESGVRLQEIVVDAADLPRSSMSSRQLPFLRKPGGLAENIDEGVLLVADAGAHCIRQVGLDGLEGPVLAGRCGALGRFDDGAADEVLLDTPTAIRRLPGGEVYFIEAGRHRVRLVRDGLVETVVGTGDAGSTRRARAGDAVLDGPRDVLVDEDGNLFVSTDGGVIVVADVDGDGLATANDLAVPIFRGDDVLGTACPGPMMLDEGTLVVVDRCSGGAAALTIAPLQRAGE
jgi:sugar lactone lactonase YvrE